MNLDLSSCIFKEKIRKLDLNGANIGGDSSYSFMGENNNSAQPFFALEIPYAKDNFYPDYINEAFGTEDFYEKLKIALNSGADMVSVKFNADESSLEALCEEIPSAPRLLSLITTMSIRTFSIVSSTYVLLT